MLPSEMVILMAIAVNKNNGRKLLTRRMDITSEYIGYLYVSLITRGYLKRFRTTGYQLTPAGRKVVSEFLNKNGTRAKDVINRLQILGIDIGPEQEKKIGRLGKGEIKVM